MRCFFFRGSRIYSVELLKKGSDDDLIRQAHALFAERKGQELDGFEIWDQKRFVYRWPWKDNQPSEASPAPSQQPMRQ